jgi:hypothetical protein
MTSWHDTSVIELQKEILQVELSSVEDNLAA